MTGTAITLGVDSATKPPAEPLLSHSRMSPLRRNSLLRQANLMHQNSQFHPGVHLHEDIHLHEEALIHQGRRQHGLSWQFEKQSFKPFFLCYSDSHMHEETHFDQEAHLLHGAHIHQETQSPLLHHDTKLKASLRVSERTWESRRIKEEMQGILSPTPLELHKVSLSLLCSCFCSEIYSFTFPTKCSQRPITM